MRSAICWGGPLHGKTHAIFRDNRFSVGDPARKDPARPFESYTLLRVTYREKPTLKVYEFSVWTASSFDCRKLDGAEIVPVLKERKLPFDVTDVPADAPCWQIKPTE